MINLWESLELKVKVNNNDNKKFFIILILMIEGDVWWIVQEHKKKKKFAGEVYQAFKNEYYYINFVSIIVF